MSKFVVCGKLDVGSGFSDIVCDVSTTDLIFCDDVNGNCLFSNLAIQDPIPTDDSAAVDNIIKSMGVEGAILSESYVILLKDYVAEYRDYKDPTKIMHTVHYDLDFVYEGNIE